MKNEFVKNYCGFEVIPPASIRVMEKPDFDSTDKEEDYANSLACFQNLISDFEKGVLDPYDPMNLPDKHTAEDIYDYMCEYRDKYTLYKRFKNFFFENPIEVRKANNGQYIGTENGQHRLYVAHKYNYRIIVHICKDSEETK